MKFQNYDVDNIELVSRAFECIPFIQEVLNVCTPCIKDAEERIDAIVSKQQLPVEPIWKMNPHSYDDVAIMIHQIPIYLVKGSGDYPEDKLGAYCSGRNGASPYIKLYIEAIDKEVQNDNEFKWLLTKVLLHEVMHAIMDTTNNPCPNFQVSKIKYTTEFGKLREEALANAGAFAIIQEYAKEPNAEQGIEAYVKDFIENQPEGYKLGVKYASTDALRRLFWMIRVKVNGVHDKIKQEWVDYAKQPLNQIDPAKLDALEELLQAEYVYKYNNQHYTDEGDLVHDIVISTLSEFESKNGRKMSSAEFMAKFPKFQTFAEMSYEISSSVQGDNRFKPIIDLGDTQYSLYDCYDNETMHKFVDGIHPNFEEYKNH